MNKVSYNGPVILAVILFIITLVIAFVPSIREPWMGVVTGIGIIFNSIWLLVTLCRDNIYD